MTRSRQQLREYYSDLLDAPPVTPPEITLVNPETISIAGLEFTSVFISDMPAGWTLDAVLVDGVALANPFKAAEGIAQGDANAPIRAGVVEVQYNSGESVSGLNCNVVA